ncbi:MAG: hypothetical protein H6668_00245 [Ardenticatenaceae bacterium]|nr:hypothetical protein [Ardenticatenaceae bacterium]
MTNTIDDLQAQIKSEQKLLLQYEDLERMERDPRNILHVQANIERTKQNILTLETRMVQLRAENTPARAVVRRESVFIANVPYGLETALHGRAQEMALLDDWFHHDHSHPLLAVIGLGGQGKSALTWLWQKQLQTNRLAPPLVVWWSFYELDGTVSQLADRLLRHFQDEPASYGSLRNKVDRVVEHLQQTPALLVLDGAERLLRAYSSLGAAYQGDSDRVDGEGLAREQMRGCVDPAAGVLLQWLAETGLTPTKTLLTSRLFPQELAGRSGLGLAGVRRHDLTGLNGAAALVLFQELGIGATRAEVEAVCAPLGYHPLSLRLLARAVRYSPTAPNDLQAAADYDPTSDLLGKREHVLRRAYDNLPPTAQHTLSRLAAFRSGVGWRVLADVFGGGGRVLAQLRQDLQRLEERGLLQRTVRRWEDGEADTHYDLHPIVRRYAYDRLSDRAGMHGQLVVYFEAVPKPQRIGSLEDLAPAIELYHHLTRAGRYDEACDLFYDRLHSPLYYQMGAYQTYTELLLALFPDGVDKLPRLSKEVAQAWTLNGLGNSYSLAGRPKTAVSFFERDIAILEKLGDKKTLVVPLGNLAYMAQIHIGELTAVSHNLRRRISLCREIEDRFNEAVGHQEYGRLLATTSNWAEAAKEFDTALEQNKADNIIQGQGITWAYCAQAALLQGEAAAALRAAQEALRLADEYARTSYPVERDYVQVYWLLGWARLGLGDLAAAQGHLDEALRRCRAINLVQLEPSILLAQARLAAAQGGQPQALALAAEAQTIAARAGYVLNLADIHNFRAGLALAAGEREAARQLAQQARGYAWCDGPPFAYQPALDEANRLLAQLPS